MIFKLIFNILNPTKTGISTSIIISSQYFFTNDFVFRIFRYAIDSSNVKRPTIAQKIISKIMITCSVIANNGSEIPNEEYSMFTNPKINITINEKVTKLSTFLNNGENSIFTTNTIRVRSL